MYPQPPGIESDSNMPKPASLPHPPNVRPDTFHRQHPGRRTFATNASHTSRLQSTVPSSITDKLTELIQFAGSIENLACLTALSLTRLRQVRKSGIIPDSLGRGIHALHRALIVYPKGNLCDLDGLWAAGMEQMHKDWKHRREVYLEGMDGDGI